MFFFFTYPFSIFFRATQGSSTWPSVFGSSVMDCIVQSFVPSNVRMRFIEPYLHILYKKDLFHNCSRLPHRASKRWETPPGEFFLRAEHIVPTVTCLIVSGKNDTERQVNGSFYFQ